MISRYCTYCFTYTVLLIFTTTWWIWYCYSFYFIGEEIESKRKRDFNPTITKYKSWNLNPRVLDSKSLHITISPNRITCFLRTGAQSDISWELHPVSTRWLVDLCNGSLSEACHFWVLQKHPSFHSSWRPLDQILVENKTCCSKTLGDPRFHSMKPFFVFQGLLLFNIQHRL